MLIDSKAIAAFRQHRYEAQAEVAFAIPRTAIQHPHSLRTLGRHNQASRAGHYPALFKGQAVSGDLTGDTLVVIDQFGDADLDEGGGVTAVAYALEQGALAAVEVIVQRADIQLWRGLR
ncbi:hypothetical protein D3C77_282490 [compost metagenome]